MGELIGQQRDDIQSCAKNKTGCRQSEKVFKRYTHEVVRVSFGHYIGSKRLMSALINFMKGVIRV